MNKIGKKIGFGIVGLGNIASTHALAISGLEEGELVAACSRSGANRSAFSEKFNVSVYSDYGEFLANDNLHAVIICTPSGTHLEYGKQAAGAGKHVIIEKPIEISVDRGRSLIECCNQNRVKLAVIYQNRFIPGVKQMKQAVDKGEIGRPVMVRASVKWFRNQEYYTQSGWRGTLEMDGGGAVINQSIHTIDLLLWIMGDVVSLSAFKGTLTHPGIEAEDNAVAAMQFKNGALGVFEASTSIVPAQSRTIEINASKGTALLEEDQFKLLKKDGIEESGSKKNSKAGAESPMAGMKAIHHQKQYQQIIDAIAGTQEPVVSGEESLRSLAVVEAIYSSAEEKKSVNMASFLKK